MGLSGAQALNLKVRGIAATVAGVLAALQNGELVVMSGDPRTSWGFDLDSKQSYLHHYGVRGSIPPPTDLRSNADHFGHWVVVFGVSTEGNFLAVSK